VKKAERFIKLKPKEMPQSLKCKIVKNAAMEIIAMMTMHTHTVNSDSVHENIRYIS
jgi:hypothetical protein